VTQVGTDAACAEDQGLRRTRSIAAHIVNALNGVRYFALTPDFLDDPKRLTWAHRKVCNKQVELGFAGILVYLWKCGIHELPTFLPEEVLKAWAAYAAANREPV